MMPTHQGHALGPLKDRRGLEHCGGSQRSAPGAKTLVAYRHGRAYMHLSDSRGREAEFAGCEALDRLLDERGAPPHLDDTHWWMKGVGSVVWEVPPIPNPAKPSSFAAKR